MAGNISTVNNVKIEEREKNKRHYLNNDEAEETWTDEETTAFLRLPSSCRYVREKTKTEVDMRVGVHSGTVLGGVLGQKRWQFDVWSTDVTVANKMESGGIPGWERTPYYTAIEFSRALYFKEVCVLHRRVHISQTTKDNLSGEFELELGDGGGRCEYLLEKGINTYLVLVPKPEASGLSGNVSYDFLSKKWGFYSSKASFIFDHSFFKLTNPDVAWIKSTQHYVKYSILFCFYREIKFFSFVFLGLLICIFKQ